MGDFLADHYTYGAMVQSIIKYLLKNRDANPNIILPRFCVIFFYERNMNIQVADYTRRKIFLRYMKYRKSHFIIT